MLRYLVVPVLLAGGIAAAQPDYFPLRPGNQWSYRASRFGSPFTVEMLAAPAEAPTGSVLARGFPGGDIVLRMADDGTLYMWNAQSKVESVWAAFGSAAGESYNTGIDRCNKTAIIGSKATRIDVPVGHFENALTISYPPFVCSDAGITSEVYLPSVGLLQRTVTSFAGPVVYDLVYARLNDGLTIITAPEQSLTLALDEVTYAPGATATARLTMRNTQAKPLRLTFPSGQQYDVAIRNDAGEVVYRWSEGRAFTMIFGTLELSGERTWLIEFPVPRKAGTYQVEAWLATSSPSPKGHVGIEVK